VEQQKMLALNHEEVLMRKQQNIVRTIFGTLVVLIALVPGVSAQVTNTWSTLGPNLATTSLAIDPGNPDIIYAGTAGGVFKSTDGGVTWRNIGLSGATALVVDFSNPNAVYAGTDIGGSCRQSPLFKSTDAGAS